MDAIQAAQIKKQADDSIFRKPNVVATGIGYKNGDPEQDLAIIASVVEKKPPGLRKGHISRFSRVAKGYDGLQTDVIQTGHYVALSNNLPTDRWRPKVPAGVSISHINVTAGTLGAWIVHDGQLKILSNNHVIANSNDAKKGDAILQPGVHDGGNESDIIAALDRWIPIEFEGEESDCDGINMIARATNLFARKLGRRSELRTYVTKREAENMVDCALATPLDPNIVLNEFIDRTKINGITQLDLNSFVHKYGRTTGHTNNVIIQKDVSANISYGPGKMARFVNQLMAGPMSSGGDSGSVVLDEENRIGGLLFAGSKTTTLINPIHLVLDSLGINF